MPEAKQYMFSYKEVAEMMVRQTGVQEGHWGIFMRFGIQGANIALNSPDLVPSAIVPVLEVGLQRFDEPTNLSVDAAEVNGTRARRRAGREATVTE